MCFCIEGLKMNTIFICILEAETIYVANDIFVGFVEGCTYMYLHNIVTIT